MVVDSGNHSLTVENIISCRFGVLLTLDKDEVQAYGVGDIGVGFVFSVCGFWFGV